MRDVTVEDIYIGNGVSELIVQAMQALLNSGDEMLVPAPDYPLWTAAVSLSGGNAVHYLCDESSDWFPDWMISAPKLRRVPVGSSSSTQTTQPARCILKSC